MNWIFDNMQLVIVIASAFAWWLNQRREKTDEAPPPSTLEKDREHYEQLRRQKKIQEDIRRKIAERRGESVPNERESPPALQRSRPTPQSTQPVEPAEPEIPPFLRELMGLPAETPKPEYRPEPPPVPTSAPVSNRQVQMEKELQALEAKRQEAEAMAASVRRSAGSKSASRRRKVRATGGALTVKDGAWLTTLRDPKSARRAIVMREILGKPVALR
jgi:hypothetical protein